MQRIPTQQAFVTLNGTFVLLSHIRFTMPREIMYNTLEFCVFNGRGI